MNPDLIVTVLYAVVIVWLLMVGVFAYTERTYSDREEPGKMALLLSTLVLGIWCVVTAFLMVAVLVAHAV